MNRSGTPGRTDGLHVIRLDDEVVLLHPDGGVHRLDRTATVVFDLCDGERSVSQIVAELSEASGLPIGEIERDVIALLAQLEGLGVLMPSMSVRVKS